MPPRKSIIPMKPLTITMSAELLEKLRIFLTSTRDGKVPKGAFQRFFVTRTEEFFRHNAAAGDALLKEIENGDSGDE